MRQSIPRLRPGTTRIWQWHGMEHGCRLPRVLKRCLSRFEGQPRELSRLNRSGILAGWEVHYQRGAPKQRQSYCRPKLLMDIQSQSAQHEGLGVEGDTAALQEADAPQQHSLAGARRW